MTPPQNFRNKKLDLISHSCKVKWKSVRQIFCKLRECEIKNSSKSVLQICFKILALNEIHPNKSTVKISSQVVRQVFEQSSIKDKFLQPWTRIELRMPLVQARVHVTPCIACEKATVNQSSFTGCFSNFFCHTFLVLGLNPCLNGV